MSILLVYGSETGCAQDTAESLRREALLRNVPARIYGLDEYEFSDLVDETIVIFVVSTTGQGEMPPNMRHFWRQLLRKSLPKDFLENLKVGVLGLGDSSYQKYNFASKKLYRRLIQLGAKMMLDLGLADDQHEIGIDGALIPWKTELWSKIYEMNLFDGMLQEPSFDIKIEPKYRFVEDFEGKNEDEVEEESEYQNLEVLENLRVTADEHFQETRLVKFASDLPYNPGDVLMVRPENPEETVQIAIEALGLTNEDLDKKRRVVQNDKFSKPPQFSIFGKITTLRICLQKYFDLHQIPKRSFFEILGYLSTDSMEKERLFELASPQGLDDLLDYSTRCRRTTAETLRDFPATAKKLKLNFDQFFELFTSIRPRAFSIASSPKSPGGQIHLIVAKVEYKSRMSTPRLGLCSTFISRLSKGDRVLCRVRAGTFKFVGPETPVICIGPGTGVAPFRSFLGERELSQPSPSTSLLFFGCRGPNLDNYFADDWKTMQNIEVITAFSRNPENQGRKIYVQHQILKNAAKVWQILNQNGSIYIAGSAGDMPKAVLAAIQEIEQEIGGQPNDWVTKAENSGRIQFETWS
ncbi:unnamed protein product [Caenorhabditis angaria]|uniref:NADPH-dependent diflavin oxidoreductase 1 n=1 Tax=Caenorhabditis angaria TaxID=860376 RepID=A0A9P1IZJ8_9PELO|nr:unnamed protein product [Caenorhabditis angaria]